MKFFQSKGWKDMKLYLYRNNGGIERVINRVKDETHGYYDSFHEMISMLNEEIKTYNGKNLTIKNEFFDFRIRKFVYCILADITMYGKKYKQQFIARFFEEELK